MSDVQNTTAPAAEPTTEAAAPVAVTDATAPAVADEPKVNGEAPKTDAAEPAAEESKTEAAPAEEAKADTTAAAEKPIEPITEGQLAYKGPGLVKSLIPSKKEFWLSDEAVAPQNLDLFMRGEKPEISHAIVAWASQTGKGLLFFNKKNETDRTHPQDVLALYDATDLKKSPPHEFSFKLHGQNHVFKATSDAERDGWYMSIEKAIELGKASKEEIRESEGYKAEMEKLNKPNTVLGAAKRSQSQPKKSTDADKTAERTGSTEEESKEDKKQKSRSTSRGMLNRLKGKKEEAEQKVAEKKEEKEADKEEKKADEEATPVAASTEAAPAAAAVAAAEVPAAGEAAETPAEEKKEEKKEDEEKPKPSKRGSIFGKVTSTWGSMKSPAKEKEQKDTELKPEAAKDGAVSENPPVLPETATTEPVTEPAVPAVEEPAAESKTEEKKDVPADAVSPGKEKSNFLSGLGFMKRNRSVSPSTNMKEPAKKEEAAETKPAETPVVDGEAKKEEPAAEAATEAAATETPAEKTEAPKETSTPNKRQSVLGSLGRRASKALNRGFAPKKENAAPAATEAKKEEAAETKPAEETPVVNGEAKKEETEEPQKSIGDVVPDAITTGQPQHSTPTVTASA